MCLQRCRVGNLQSLFPKFTFAWQVLCPPPMSQYCFSLWCAFSVWRAQLRVWCRADRALTDPAHSFPQSANLGGLIPGPFFQVLLPGTCQRICPWPTAHHPNSNFSQLFTSPSSRPSRLFYSWIWCFFSPIKCPYGGFFVSFKRIPDIFKI